MPALGRVGRRTVQFADVPVASDGRAARVDSVARPTHPVHVVDGDVGRSKAFLNLRASLLLSRGPAPVERPARFSAVVNVPRFRRNFLSSAATG